MDKFDFNIKVEQIKKMAKVGDYSGAMKVANEIDWRRVSSVSLLTLVSEIYEKNRDYSEAKEILILAYEKAPIGKRLLYKLTILALNEGNIAEAEAYYREFYDLAPDDSRQHILRYLILKAKGAPTDQLINTLERYTKDELDERWMYELAELYHIAGRSEECVAMCDKVMLMFGIGKYVDKAMDLKLNQEGCPLNEYQQNLINNRDMYEERLKDMEEHPDQYDPDADAVVVEKPENYNQENMVTEEPEEYETRPISGAAARKGLRNEEAYGATAKAPEQDEIVKADLGAILGGAYAMGNASAQIQEEDEIKLDLDGIFAAKAGGNSVDAEAERIRAEEEARAEAERIKAEEEARAEAERVRAEEEARAEAERIKAEEEARAEAERIKAEEEARAEAERIKAEEEARAEAERIKAEEEARAEAERIKAEEEARAEAERIKAEEEARAEAERIKVEEAPVTVVSAEYEAENKETQGEDEEEMTIYTVNFIVERRKEEDGANAAIRLLKLMHEHTGSQNKVAKIKASKINSIGVLASRDKLAGKDLVIEQAGDLAYSIVEEVMELIKLEPTERVVVLIDNPMQIRKMLSAYPELLQLFHVDKEEDSVVQEPEEEPKKEPAPVVRTTPVQQPETPKATAPKPVAPKPAYSDDYYDEPAPEPIKTQAGGMTNTAADRAMQAKMNEEMDIDEFANYAQEYAESIDCSISGKSKLALYERIELMEEDGVKLTRENAIALIEEAADKAEKKGIGSLFKAKYDKDDKLILREEHFVN